MSSPYIIPFNDRLCTEKKCEPFFIREWETMLIGALICATLLYVMSCCNGPERFSTADNKMVYDRRSSAQAHMVVDDRVGHEGARTDMFATHVKPTTGVVLQGNSYFLRGPSTSKFTDFAAIDKIDGLVEGEPDPVHAPETSDDTLELMIR